MLLLAHPPSAGYRVRKFARRYRGQLTAAAALFVALAGGLLATLFFWRQADTLAAEKDEQFQLARQNLEHFHQAANLVLLEDDRQFFPPYYAVPVVNGPTLQRYPEIAQALSPLAGALDDETMQRLNYAVDEHKRSPEEVAREFLIERGLLD